MNDPNQVNDPAQVKSPALVSAHTQIDREAIVFYYPDHQPREADPHYHLFNAAKKRILATGIGCWICGTTENLELHHSECEYAAATGVDVERFAELFPDYHVTDEESFLCYVESEGNLQVLCALHHRSPYAGIHHCVFPAWKLQRFWRKDLPPPVGPVNPSAPNVEMPTGEQP